jgi:SIR2-like domain
MNKASEPAPPTETQPNDVVKPTSTVGKAMFYNGDAGTWKDLTAEIPEGAEADATAKLIQEAKTNRAVLKSFLLSSLQMQHVVVLAGSGTSMGAANGPSMATLWDFCVNSNPDSGKGVTRTWTDLAKTVMTAVGFDAATDHGNIEALLSRCEAHVQLKDDADVSLFLGESKQQILNKCSQFIDSQKPEQLAAHCTFLRRLSRRRVRDSRLKLFTTNYDICFELAAGKQNLVAIDGFSFTQPREFDPRFFLYDIVRRPSSGDEAGTPLEGVFHIYKLHGSVNWARKNGTIEVDANPGAAAACLIYPAKGKYQQSYVQPHLELIAQYFSALREPNTCLIVAGFGFNDDHLSEPILAAVRTNPHLRLIVVNQSAQDLTDGVRNGENQFLTRLFELAKQDGDICFLNADFGEFADLIPDLRSLTPAERLTRDIKAVAAQQ